MLLFKKKFIELIRRGEKTQTIRVWKRPMMRAGQRSYIPGIGYVSILSIEHIELDQLTDADAVPDGFSTAEELRKEIRSLYNAEARREQRTFRIRFKVFPPDEQAKMKEERLKQKERDAKQREKDAQKSVEKTLEKLRKLAETT